MLPLLDADEVRAEIAETDAELGELLHGRPVCEERLLELRDRKLARRARLVEQLEAMEARTDG